MQVWKYELDSSGIIRMPNGAKPLSIHMQRDIICMWVLVDPEELFVRRRFIIVGTGHEVPPCGAFIGTFLTENDSLVFHVFEE